MLSPKSLRSEAIKEKCECPCDKFAHTRNPPPVPTCRGGKGCSGGNMWGEVVGASLWIAKDFQWICFDILYTTLHFLIQSSKDVLKDLDFSQNDRFGVNMNPVTNITLDIQISRQHLPESDPIDRIDPPPLLPKQKEKTPTPQYQPGNAMCGNISCDARLSYFDLPSSHKASCNNR